MNLLCPCGNFHDLVPAGMAVVIHAYQTGDILRYRDGIVESMCIMEAFTEENVSYIQNRYPNRLIVRKVAA